MFPSGLKSGVEAYNCAVPNTPAMDCTACRLPANSGVEGGLKMLTNMGRSGERTVERLRWAMGVLPFMWWLVLAKPRQGASPSPRCLRQKSKG